MQEKENIIFILKETRMALRKKNGRKLRSLADRTNHVAAIYQDPDNIIIAVLVYTLGKVLEREQYHKMAGWNFFIKEISKKLDETISFLKKDDLGKFRNHLGEMRNVINKVDGNLKDYIGDVFYKAGINRAFKYYEHGLSSQRTAELLGVSLWDLSSFIGQNNVFELKSAESVPVEDRIKLVEEILK